MRPGADDEFALFCFFGATVQALAVEVGEGLCRVQIVPTAHVERGDGDFTPFGFVVELLPIVVVSGVFDPVFPEIQVAACLFIPFR